MTARGQTVALWTIALACLGLLWLAVLSSNGTFIAYRRDLENNRQYCEANENADERKNAKDCQSFMYRTFDDPVAFFTAALWAATVALFVATFGLFLYAARQSQDAREAAAAAKASADAALASVRIGADQTKIMAGQRDIARKQTAVLEAQARTTQILADLERPVLFVRGVESIEFEPFPEAAPGGAAQRRPLARIRFANYGRTPAVLLGIEGTVAVAGGVPPEPDYGGAAHREMRLQVVEAGEGNGVSARIEGRLVTDGEAHLAQSDQLLTLVYGRLVYRDAFGDRAATGFGYLMRGGKPLPLPFAAYNYRKTYGPEDQGAPHADYEL